MREPGGQKPAAAALRRGAGAVSGSLHGAEQRRRVVLRGRRLHKAPPISHPRQRQRHVLCPAEGEHAAEPRGAAADDGGRKGRGRRADHHLREQGRAGGASDAHLARARDVLPARRPRDEAGGLRCSAFGLPHPHPSLRVLGPVRGDSHLVEQVQGQGGRQHRLGPGAPPCDRSVVQRLPLCRRLSSRGGGDQVREAAGLVAPGRAPSLPCSAGHPSACCALPLPSQGSRCRGEDCGGDGGRSGNATTSF